MRKLLLAGACALTVSSGVQAGGLAPVVVEPDVIVEDTGSSSAGALVPLLVVLVIAAVAATAACNGPACLGTSDARLKEDILKVGMTANGLPLYHFRYIGLPQVWEGVMAQDVAKKYPEAVLTMPGGWLAVNYGMLGLEMRAVH